MTAPKFIEFPAHVEGSSFHIDGNRIVCIGSHRDAGKAYVWIGPAEDDCFVVSESPAAARARVEAAYRQPAAALTEAEQDDLTNTIGAEMDAADADDNDERMPAAVAADAAAAWFARRGGAR